MVLFFALLYFNRTIQAPTTTFDPLVKSCLILIGSLQFFDVTQIQSCDKTAAEGLEK